MWIRVLDNAEIINLPNGKISIDIDKNLFGYFIKVTTYGEFRKLGRYETKEEATAEFEKICRALKNGNDYCEIFQGLPPVEETNESIENI